MVYCLVWAINLVNCLFDLIASILIRGLPTFLHSISLKSNSTLQHVLPFLLCLWHLHSPPIGHPWPWRALPACLYSGATPYPSEDHKPTQKQKQILNSSKFLAYSKYYYNWIFLWKRSFKRCFLYKTGQDIILFSTHSEQLMKHMLTTRSKNHQ